MTLRLDFEALPMTVAIVGSREFPKPIWVKRFVWALKPGTLVISGGARGVDREAEDAARDRHANGGMPLPMVIKPNEQLIRKLGFRTAAFMRNEEIVLAAKERDGIVVAFLLDPPRTGGTDNTLEHCDTHDVPSITFRMDKGGTWLEPKLNATILTERWKPLFL